MRSSSGKRKPWTVLAYTVADDQSDGDSLDASAVKELRAVCDAADFFEDVSVAAQVDFKGSPRGVYRGVVAQTLQKKRSHQGFREIRTHAHTLWRGIRSRLEHSKLRVLKEETDLNAARAGVLKNFLRFGKQECPADRYVVFFYGHGYGPMGLFYDADVSKAEGKTMPLGGLAAAVEALGDRAAIMVFRACNINTLEAAYQLKEAASFMIASQSVVPIRGIWPWETFMTALLPGAASGDVAQSIARQLALFLRVPAHRKPFADVPSTLIDLGAADAIAKPLKALATALHASRDRPSRASACSKALESARVGFPGTPSNPGDPALLDVGTMCAKLQTLTRYPAVAGPARALGELVETRLVKWHASQQDRHRGIAIFYKPVRKRHLDRSHIFNEATSETDDGHYRQLALSRATGWDRIALDPLG